MELLALERGRVYVRTRAALDRGFHLIAEAKQRLCEAERRVNIAGWQDQLGNPASCGTWTTKAIRPLLTQWLEREHGLIRMTQVLTGHGCFGGYLRRIQREPTERCHHCTSGRDTARHTLEYCTAWANERCVLRMIIGGRVSLSAVVRSMVESRAGWEAVSSFCESVMSQKEDDEWFRREEALSLVLRGIPGLRARRYRSQRLAHRR